MSYSQTKRRTFTSVFIITTLLLLSIFFIVSSVSASEKKIDRVSGSNRYDTAIKVSQEGWPNGADTVVIAVGDNFPDALAGAPLAHKYDAPILLVPKSNIPSYVADEIRRLKAKNAYILGGTSVIHKNVEQQLINLGVKVERVAGKNRYQTAAKIAQMVGGDKAVVSYGENFPDSLSIASYAASQSMPILLTEKNYIPEETKVALKSYSSTLVIGGVNVVSEKVSKELPESTRITGSNRYETASKVVETLYSDSKVDNTMVATGESFADALTGSVIAAKQNNPIILVKSDDVPTVVRDTIKDYSLDKFTIIGGTSVVSTHAENLLTFDPSVIVKTAKQYIGTPYKWGGTSPSGFDCSGYIGYVFGKHNINVPRTTTGMWDEGKRVGSPSVGDLVVFETYKPGPSHVGIYMGNNEFIHAGNDGVEVTSMNNVYFKPRYLGSVRVID
jgi:putative cell wall-binding protein